MKLSSEMEDITPLLHFPSLLLQNCVLTDTLSEEDTAFYNNYLKAQFYWHKNFRETP